MIVSGFCNLWDGSLYEPPSSPRVPGDKSINQRIHMVLPRAPDTQAAEDGLVRHQKEGRPLVLERLNAAV